MIERLTEKSLGGSLVLPHQRLLRGGENHSCNCVEVGSEVVEGVLQESHVASMGRIEGVWVEEHAIQLAFSEERLEPLTSTI